MTSVIMTHHTHYALECPKCRTTVESCGCTAAPRYPARIPCQSCTNKLSMEFPLRDKRASERWRRNDGGKP